MAKGLLLGNGINSRLCIKGLSVEDISRRFTKNVFAYSVMINNLFGVQITEDVLKSIGISACESGIEILAGGLYNHIKECKSDTWTDNDEYRLQDVITCIGITSIFYTESGKIEQGYDKGQMFQIDDYKYIFTLNYIEFWDDEHRCIHLHGKVDLSQLDDKMNAISEIVFAPSEVEKNRLIRIAGMYPSDKLYPADDLFFYRSKELYSALDLVDEIDVFGMSPFGEESIIEKINEKKLVRIFIYNKKTNNETNVWKSKLKCQYELLEADDMK